MRNHVARTAAYYVSLFGGIKMDKKNLYVTVLLFVSNCHAMDGSKGIYPSAPPATGQSVLLASSQPHVSVSHEELERLLTENKDLKDRELQDRLRIQQEQQGDRRYRGNSTAVVASAESSSGHYRQRSMSDTSLGGRIPEGSPVPPGYTVFETHITDGSLQLGLDTLEQMKRMFEKLCATTGEALKERALAHQKISEGQLTPELPRASGVDRFRSKESRTKRHLDAQVKKHTKLREDSGRAFNYLLAAVITANTSLEKLQEAVTNGAEKATEKHAEIERRASLQGTRRRTTSEPSASAYREFPFSPTDTVEA